MQMMRRVVDQALVLVPTAEGSVVELAEGQLMTYVCCAGSLTRAVGLTLQMSSSLSGRAVSTATTLRCDNAYEDNRVDRDACIEVGAISMVCVPLLHQGQAVGVLKVTSAAVSAFDDDDVATLASLAEFISAAISTTAELNRAAGNLFQATDQPGPKRSERARFVANVLRPGLLDDVEGRQRTEDVLEADAFDIVFQPEVDLARQVVVGAEALARFRPQPYRPPDVWFAEAHRAGLGPELELAAVRKAFRAAEALPPTGFVAVNLGPAAIAHPLCLDVLDAIDPRRLMVELTEHVEVDDYPLLRRLLLTLRQRGVRLAVDDTGAGFASLSHVVNLAPDIIKLDLALVRGIDLDPVRRSLATAVVAFAKDTGAKVTAEGIETAAQLECVRGLGIDYGQGYYLCPPAPAAGMARYARAVHDNKTILSLELP
jgi:EAL domain-containing protein (putative c-di-GMP-specific phosphodiesterase class I)